MDAERLDRLMDLFAQILPEKVDQYPDIYHYQASDCPAVCARIRANLEKHEGIALQNIDSPTWRAVCKGLGIKHTRKAVTTFLNND